MKIPALFLLCVFASCLLPGCGQKQNQAQQGNLDTADVKTDDKRARIVFFGNSLTAAFGLDQAQGFPALVQQKIDSAGLPYQVQNAGLSGETTAGGASRVDWMLRQPLDVFVLELGGNDGLRGLPVAQSTQNLQSIIDKVRQKYPQAKILLCGMLAPPNMGADYSRQFSEMYTHLAQKNSLPLLPFILEGVAANPSLNLADGIHPNIEGQKIVAANVWKYLRPMLKG